jgi:hypothetical protein
MEDAEIEVTEAMIQAGLNAETVGNQYDLPPKEHLAYVYREMERVRLTALGRRAAPIDPIRPVEQEAGGDVDRDSRA